MVGSFFLGVVLGLGRARRAKRTRHHFLFSFFFCLVSPKSYFYLIEYDTISCRQQRLDDLDESFKRVSFITTGKTRRENLAALLFRRGEVDAGFFRLRRLRDALAFGTVERVPPSPWGK